MTYDLKIIEVKHLIYIIEFILFKLICFIQRVTKLGVYKIL
jgi:hypothetical protein